MTQGRRTRRFRPQLLLGIGCLLLAILLNPWTLESYVVLDGHLDKTWRVLTVEVLLFAAGAWMVFRALRAPARTERHSRRHFAFGVLGLVLASLFVAASAELALRFLASPLAVLEGDAWWAYLWRADRSERPEDGGLSYAHDRYDAALGWRPVPDYDRDGIRTNSLGIRADREFAFERDPTVARIVAVGDSYTWGEHTFSRQIDNRQTYPAVLEHLLPETEVLNLGVHGWGTDQQYLYLTSLGLRFQPDLVILGFYEYNLERNDASFFNYAKPRFLLEDGELLLTGSPVPPPDEILAEPLRFPSFYLAAFVRKRVDRMLDQTKLRPIETRRAWRVTRAILEAARRETEATGAHFLLVYIPHEIGRWATAVETAVVDWSEQTGTHLLNLRPVFASRPEADWNELYDGHWTAKGHAVAAEAVRDYILDAALL
jgi:hypothetical protein